MSDAAKKHQSLPCDVGMSIQDFKADNLKHQETQEKNTLPTKEGE